MTSSKKDSVLTRVRRMERTRDLRKAWAIYDECANCIAQAITRNKISTLLVLPPCSDDDIAWVRNKLHAQHFVTTLKDTTLYNPKTATTSSVKEMSIRVDVSEEGEITPLDE